ncbi:MAG TPA: hypothetical protein VKG25_21835 [Bryobacteraceae bacterium]|nr:hypothetical protein [Bryobacteraceae bacterium]
MPETVQLRQQAYDEASARMRDEMADRIDQRAGAMASGAEELHEPMKQTLHHAEAEASQQLPATRAQSFVSLLHDMDALTNCLAAEIATASPN